MASNKKRAFKAAKFLDISVPEVLPAGVDRKKLKFEIFCFDRYQKMGIGMRYQGLNGGDSHRNSMTKPFPVWEIPQVSIDEAKELLVVWLGEQLEA